MINHPNRKKVHDWPEFLRKFRASHGLTQKTLADLLQISVRNVENWEEGLSTPPEYLKKAMTNLDNKKTEKNS